MYYHMLSLLKFIVGGIGFAPMQIPKYQNVNHIPHFVITLNLVTMETTMKVVVGTGLEPVIFRMKI